MQFDSIADTTIAILSSCIRQPPVQNPMICVFVKKKISLDWFYCTFVCFSRQNPYKPTRFLFYSVSFCTIISLKPSYSWTLNINIIQYGLILFITAKCICYMICKKVSYGWTYVIGLDQNPRVMHSI